MVSPAAPPSTPAKLATDPGSRQVVFASAALFLLVVAVFLPSLRNDFTNFDDPDYVLWNPHVRSGLTLGNIFWAFGSLYAGNWHPLTWVSHMADCQLYGLRAWGHHLTSVLLHAGSTVVLFLFLKRTTGAFWRSLCVAALFGLHPLRVESVAWVAERKDVLSTFLFFLTLMTYAAYAKSAVHSPQSAVHSPGSTVIYPKSEVRSLKSEVAENTWFWYAAALAFFALGLMSKPMLVTLPFLLLLLDFWPLQRFKISGVRSTAEALRPLLLEKIPFLLLALAASAVAVVAQQRSGGVAVMDRIPWHVILGNAGISYVRYIGKLLYPVDLAVFYPYSRSWPAAAILAAAAGLLSMSALALAQMSKRPYFATGWFWFVGTLVPVIGLIQVGGQSIADRYTYIPSLGFLICLVWGASELSSRSRNGSVILGAVLGALVACCGVLTVRQIGWWKDGETLFRHSLAVTGDNYMAHLNLGSALQHKGVSPDEAMAHFREASRLRPRSFAAHMNLAIMLDQAGRLEEAAGEYQQALRLSPGEIELRFNLGVVLYKLRRFDAAMQEFREIIKLKPGYSEAHQDLGGLLYLAGHLDEAISEYEEALRLKPDNAIAKDALNHLRPLKAREKTGGASP